ncbi:MAG: bifunctional DNA primase/polymerase, partial [Gemmataceae bacterium]|nr:bifunctional DNA primase/polymerase [Gemmataceae bacterium]
MQSIPNGVNTGASRSVLSYAEAYAAAGLSVIAVRADGSKQPALNAWKDYQTNPPLLDELHDWFSDDTKGIAIVGGKVSGGLLVLDFEFLDFFEEWRALVEAQAPGLTARLPTVHTPGKDEAGGRHVYARSSGPAVRSHTLARMKRAEAERRTGDPGRTTAIEVKAEGGYVLTVGCPAACHPKGRLYQHIAGPPIEKTPTLTETEVNLLLDCARALERGDQAAADWEPQAPGGDGNRPGDDFNRRGSWDFMAGWKKVRENGEVIYLCRPGKAAGVSATIGYCRSARAGPKLYVFSTNAEPFEAERSYSKFGAYTVLHHGGDFKAAARELAKQGYGQPGPTSIGAPASEPGEPPLPLNAVPEAAAFPIE